MLLAGPAAARPGSPASQPDIETITFVDYWSHAGPGPHPTDCSGSFRFISGGIRWPAAAVTYDLLNGTIPAGLSSGAVASAVQAALDAWTDADTDGDATNAPAFSDSGATDPDTVGWASLGTTGIVAATSVSYLPASKTITGFDITFKTSTGAPQARRTPSTSATSAPTRPDTPSGWITSARRRTVSRPCTASPLNRRS